mmetsp:Transcript_8576/g.23278  ORF Transcript_8576/g.23278 Transcript_8576/m.23278 type:complete len:88 (-) Transcript_8576:7-270(-)
MAAPNVIAFGWQSQRRANPSNSAAASHSEPLEQAFNATLQATMLLRATSDVCDPPLASSMAVLHLPPPPQVEVARFRSVEDTGEARC